MPLQHIGGKSGMSCFGGRATVIVGFWGDHQILPVSDRLARFDLDV